MNVTSPQHLAIIMDGNGRWAQARGKSRTHGHLRGAKVAKNIISSAIKENIKNLTLFAFSNENWFRPNEEVNFLMKLLARQISREQNSLVKNNVRFRVIGDLDRLPPPVKSVVFDTINKTESNTGMNLVFALSYGGRQEIVNAAKKISAKVTSGEISLEQIDETLFNQNMDSNFLPDPDLIIRTSGEQRLSNFFLWQAAYAEIYTADKMWPDYTAEDLNLALKNFANRRRRYGRIESPAVEKNLFNRDATIS